MSPHRSFRVTAILICSAIISAFTAQARQQAANSADHAPKEWAAVLNAYLAHDEAGQRTVDEAASHAEDPNTRQLAAMLLEEWDFRSNAEALARPKQVFMPKLPPDLLEGQPDTVQTETFVFDITIGKDGLVTSADFRNPPKQPSLADVAKARVLGALYRPVFDGREFVSFPAAVSMTIDVK
jgi:hypothetical protein